MGWVKLPSGAFVPDTLTTKGDLLVHDGTDYQRLGVGTDSHVVTADSATALGVKWAAPAGGGGDSVPRRVQYLAERLPSETAHVDDKFWHDEGGVTGTEVVGDGSATKSWDQDLGLLLLDIYGSGGAGAREPVARAWPLTPTTPPVTIETHFIISTNIGSGHSPAVMLGFSDGTAAGSTQVNAYSYLAMQGILESHGTFNNNGFAGFNDTAQSARLDVYQRVVWISANTYQVQLSPTLVTDWTAAGMGTFAKTMTPTHFWVGAANISAGAANQITVGWDYIRVFEADLSV